MPLDYTPAQIERFWSRVDKRSTNECWPWVGFINKSGYGYGYMGDGSELAHRVAWKLTNGEIPVRLLVCHSCDNPPCCNPAHLWLGTIAENCADKMAKGRHRCAGIPGENHPMAKLTNEQVIDIRRRFAAGETIKQLASDFGVRDTTIRPIVRGKQWRHLLDAA